MLGTTQKQPADQLDYDVDFEKWIPEDDTVTSAIAVASTIDDDATPLVVDSVQLSGTIVKVWLSGGTDGQSYTVTVTASTAGGRIKEEEFKIRVRDS